MPLRGKAFVSGQYYHIYNRGAGRSKVYFGEENYEFCIDLLEKYGAKYHIDVVAFCLMPNHYHFLLHQEGEVPISKFMNVLFNAYVQAMNRQQGRSGTLFEGRFKHKCIEEDQYLVHLCRYIHLNPVSAGLVNHPEEWPYSDYPDWIRNRPDILKGKKYVSEFFRSPEDYQEFVLEQQYSKQVEEKMRQYLFEEL